LPLEGRPLSTIIFPTNSISIAVRIETDGNVNIGNWSGENMIVNQAIGYCFYPVLQI